MYYKLPHVCPEMVDFGSGQGRSDLATAGVAELRRGLQGTRTPAGAKRCRLWIDTAMDGRNFLWRRRLFAGFDKIVEERIRDAQRRGMFNHLEGAGKPLKQDEFANVPEELRMAYKILKNADMLPPEIELKKEIIQTEDLLRGMGDTAEKYRTIKKLNFLILKLNSMRSGSIEFEIPQYYENKMIDRLETTRPGTKR